MASINPTMTKKKIFLFSILAFLKIIKRNLSWYKKGIDIMQVTIKYTIPNKIMSNIFKLNEGPPTNSLPNNTVWTIAPNKLVKIQPKF